MPGKLQCNICTTSSMSLALVQLFFCFLLDNTTRTSSSAAHTFAIFDFMHLPTNLQPTSIVVSRSNATETGMARLVRRTYQSTDKSIDKNLARFFSRILCNHYRTACILTPRHPEDGQKSDRNTSV